MINYQTILSLYDDKLTLMQWLKKVEAALDGASLSSIEFTYPQPNEAVITLVFADGTQVVSPTMHISIPAQEVASIIEGEGGNVVITAEGDKVKISLAQNLTISDLTANGDATLNGDVSVGNDLSVGANLDAQHGTCDLGDANVHGDMAVSGESNFDQYATFENDVEVKGDLDLQGGFNATAAAVNGIVSLLLGKFVRIIEPPQSTTLTDEQINIFKEGCFVNGDFLNFRNPVILPPENDNNNNLKGLILGRTLPAVGAWQMGIFEYFINGATKEINLTGNRYSINHGGLTNIGGKVYLGVNAAGEVHVGDDALTDVWLNGKKLYFRNKEVPPIPTDNTKRWVLLLDTDGTLQWVDVSTL